MISYEPLFALMKRKNVTRYRLEKLGFDHVIFSNMQAGKLVSSNTLNKLCIMLNCQPKDIIKFTMTDDDIALKKKLKERITK